MPERCEDCGQVLSTLPELVFHYDRVCKPPGRRYACGYRCRNRDHPHLEGVPYATM